MEISREEYEAIRQAALNLKSARGGRGDDWKDAWDDLIEALKPKSRRPTLVKLSDICCGYGGTQIRSMGYAINYYIQSVLDRHDQVSTPTAIAILIADLKAYTGEEQC